MKKIMLVCSAGMSTSLLVTKMQNAARERDFSVEIFAVPESEASNYMDIDVVLLGPQVRFLHSKIEKMMGGTPVEVINSIDYGTMNGNKVLNHAIDLMK